jgi:hypothetical protein
MGRTEDKYWSSVNLDNDVDRCARYEIGRVFGFRMATDAGLTDE